MSSGESSRTIEAALAAAVTRDGTRLAELSRSAPTLVVFLRHFG